MGEPITNEVLVERVDGIRQDIAELKQMLVESYVTRHEFEPVKRIVYGGTGLVLIAVVVGLLALIGLKG